MKEKEEEEYEEEEYEGYSFCFNLFLSHYNDSHLAEVDSIVLHDSEQEPMGEP